MSPEELSREEEAAAGRQLTNAIVANLAAELNEMGGPDLVRQVFERVGEERDPTDVSFLLGWSTLANVVDLYRTAVEVTGDPDVPFRAGRWSFKTVAVAEFVDALRALGDPAELLRLIEPVAARVTTVTDAAPDEVGDQHAVIRYHTRPPYGRDPVMCAYTMGTLSSIPTVYGLAPGEVTEVECQTRGDSHCVYRITWDPSTGEDASDEARIAALEERIEVIASRFEHLQRATGMLSMSHDIDAVIESLVRVAGMVVTAPHHLFVGRLPGEREPRVHAVGMSDEQADILAAELLENGPSPAGPHSWRGTRLAVEVASARRHYGHLAAYASGNFLPDDDRMFSAYTLRAAEALDAAVVFVETRLLLDLSSQLSEITSVEEMTARIAQSALRVVAADRAAVLLWQPASEALELAAAAGWDGERAEPVIDEAPTANGDGAAVPVDGTALLTWALSAKGTPTNAWEDPLLEPVQRAAGFERGIAAPLVARRQLPGLVLLETAGGLLDRDEDVTRRMTGLASLAASALDSARLLEMVQHQANHDILTGLPNVRLFGDRLTTALASCRRTGSALAVLFVDLDGFKDVNDRLGHAAGDRVLCEVANRLSGTVRESDSVARLGGDEFVVLVPTLATPDEAETARERIVAALETEPLALGGEEIHLRASIGLARYPEDGESPGDLLRHADSAMYETKLRHRALQF